MRALTVLNRLQMPGGRQVTRDRRDLALSRRLSLDRTRQHKRRARQHSRRAGRNGPAVHWAPYYAHTHWQRGNLLLRMGRPDDAFAELRKAAATNQTYFPNLLDLAWSVSRSDVKATEDLIGIINDNERLALIRFLAGKGEETKSSISLVSCPDHYSRRTPKKLFVCCWPLFAKRLESRSGPTILNANFEDPFVLNDSGFGWIVSPQQTKNRLAVDVSEKARRHEEFADRLDGVWTPDTPLLSQTIIVEPETTYRLAFSVKNKRSGNWRPAGYHHERRYK